MKRILVVDNGGETVKAGYVDYQKSILDVLPTVFPNATAKIGPINSNSQVNLIADQIPQHCYSSAGGTYAHFCRPIERYQLH